MNGHWDWDDDLEERLEALTKRDEWLGAVMIMVAAALGTGIGIIVGAWLW